jgi:hypothetical protein
MLNSKPSNKASTNPKESSQAREVLHSWLSLRQVSQVLIIHVNVLLDVGCPGCMTAKGSYLLRAFFRKNSIMIHQL